MGIGSLFLKQALSYPGKSCTRLVAIHDSSVRVMLALPRDSVRGTLVQLKPEWRSTPPVTRSLVSPTCRQNDCFVKSMTRLPTPWRTSAARNLVSASESSGFTRTVERTCTHVQSGQEGSPRSCSVRALWQIAQFSLEKILWART